MVSVGDGWELTIKATTSREELQGTNGFNSVRAKIKTHKTMTAKDVTGLYAFFSARKSGNFLHILG